MPRAAQKTPAMRVIVHSFRLRPKVLPFKLLSMVDHQSHPVSFWRTMSPCSVCLPDLPPSTTNRSNWKNWLTTVCLFKICSSFNPFCTNSCILLGSCTSLFSRNASCVLLMAYSLKLYAANCEPCRNNWRYRDLTCCGPSPLRDDKADMLQFVLESETLARECEGYVILLACLQDGFAHRPRRIPFSSSARRSAIRR